MEKLWHSQVSSGDFILIFSHSGWHFSLIFCFYRYYPTTESYSNVRNVNPAITNGNGEKQLNDDQSDIDTKYSMVRIQH